MKLGTLFSDAVKGAVTLAVVGALLGAAAPALATALAPMLAPAVVEAAMATSVLWTAAFFGAFGALNAAVAPLCGALFGDKKQETPAEAKTKTTQVIIVRPAHEQSAPSVNLTHNDVDIKHLSIGSDNHIAFENPVARNDFTARLEEKRARMVIPMEGNQLLH